MDSDDVRSSEGRQFQIAGPETAKLRWPMLVLVLRRTSAQLTADRSCHLLSTDATGTHTSDRYDCAEPIDATIRDQLPKL